MNWTFDQLQIFVTAVDQGSFSAAARKLGKVQSRVSSAISDLEISLGFELFDRSGRYPALTPEGNKMYNEAKAILVQCERMQASAQTVANGQESQLILAMDEALPVAPFENIFTQLAQEFPLLTLTIITGAKDEVAHWVDNEKADIGLVFDLTLLPDSLELMSIGQFRHELIVSPDHPLAMTPYPTVTDLNQFRQLMITDQLEKVSSQPISTKHWFVNHYNCIALLAALGVGWAIVPEHIASQYIESNRLVKLSMDMIPNSLSVEMGVVKRIDHANGPIVTWLYSQLKTLF